MVEHLYEVHPTSRDAFRFFATCTCGWASSDYDHWADADLSARLHTRQDEPWEGIE